MPPPLSPRAPPRAYELLSGAKMVRSSVRGCLSLAAPRALAEEQAGVQQADATGTQEECAWRVGVIAHDSMQGRDTPSPGLNKTAEWIASEFRRMGLRG